MREDMGGGRCPGCGTLLARAGQLVCQGCFTPLGLLRARHADSGGDPAAADARPRIVPAEATDPGGRSADRPLDRGIRLSFPGGQSVVVGPGARIGIGRDPRECPCVPFLARYDGLSRVHARVGVEPDGSAWITDEGSTNGTFVHGYRLAPLEPVALRPGDSVRLAGDLIMRVGE